MSVVMGGVVAGILWATPGIYFIAVCVRDIRRAERIALGDFVPDVTVDEIEAGWRDQLARIRALPETPSRETS